MSNLILDPDNNLWTIDWTCAGGYPVYFEEAHLKNCAGPEDSEFSEELLKIISNKVHTTELQRLKRLGFAVTTGWLLQPRGSSTSVEEILDRVQARVLGNV